ncbi:MAG TPA: hypothetical protein VK539_06865 [Myxococcaceae bacterium]|nr:hypothetical protein [Myxococcaceae bacterium]
MGFLDAWMFRKWPRPAQPASLALDLAGARLGSFTLGSPVQGLAESLGPPASYWAMRRGWWHYPESGLAFTEKHGRIDYMTIVASHPEKTLLQGFMARFRPYSGLVRLAHGSERASNVREQSLREVLGTPISEDREEAIVLLTFRKSGVEFEVELLPSGHLVYLGLTPASE